jgi:hypothetical protein
MHPRNASTPRVRHRWAAGFAGLSLAALALGSTAAPATAAIHPGDATVRTKEIVVLQTDFHRQGRVRCPSGHRAIGGGVAFHRPELPLAALDTKLISSSPTEDGRGWHGAGASFDVEPVQMRITVACLPAIKVGVFVVRTKDLVVPLQPFRVTGTLGCGKGQRLVTGGAYWGPGPGGPTPTGADAIHRSTPTPDGKRWHVEGVGYNSTGKILRMVVLCRPLAAVGPVTVKHRDIDGASTDRAGSVSCGIGKRAVAGGVDWYQEGKRAFAGNSSGTTVLPTLRGWFASGSSGDPKVSMRITVLCLPA